MVPALSLIVADDVCRDPDVASWNCEDDQLLTRITRISPDGKTAVTDVPFLYGRLAIAANGTAYLGRRTNEAGDEIYSLDPALQLRSIVYSQYVPEDMSRPPPFTYRSLIASNEGSLLLFLDEGVILRRTLPNRAR